MGTTALFAEVLIIGNQGITWIMFIVLSIFGHSWIMHLKTALDGWTALTTIILIAVFYTFGIIIDRCFIAYTRICNPSKWLSSISCVKKKAKAAFDEENMPIIYLQEGTLALNQTYLATRLRIVRATFFNFSLILVTSIIWFCVRTDKSAFTISIILIIGLILLFMSLVAYTVLELTFEDRNKKVKALSLGTGADVA